MTYGIKRFAFATLTLVLVLGGAAQGWASPPESARRPSVSEADRLCLAKTIYFEGRDQPLVGRKAIAAVVLNRVKSAVFPSTICGVVAQRNRFGCQFTWWCHSRHAPLRDKEAWEAAQRMADAMIAGAYDDPTNGALYFHHRRDGARWKQDVERVVLLGDHLFYR